jgi:hypothetical protein
MSLGEPGLPAGFLWRDREYRVVRLVRRWRQFGPESGGKEQYLRRHYVDAVMDDGSQWVVYCLRQPQGVGGSGGRWFVYSIESGDGTRGAEGDPAPPHPTSS